MSPLLPETILATWPRVLAHGLSFDGDGNDPAFVAVAVALAIGVGLWGGAWIARHLKLEPRLMQAFGAGALAFLFYDLVKEAASLGQNLVAFRPGVPATLLVTFVVVAILVGRGLQGADVSRAAWVWAFGILAHSLGEAWTVGTEIVTVDLLSATQGGSFFLHKLVEGFTIPLVAGLSLRGPVTERIGLVAGLASIAATLFGWLVVSTMAPLIMFAACAGALMIGIVHLGGGLTTGTRTAVAAAAGAAFVFLAGALHQF